MSNYRYQRALRLNQSCATDAFLDGVDAPAQRHQCAIAWSLVTAAFIEHAADAGSRNTAFYQRRRAQLLTARSTELGGIASFVTVVGQPINVARSGNIVAAFTFDDIAWTEVQQRTFSAATTEIHRRNLAGAPVLATTGAVTSMAAGAISKLGWKIVQLKPQR